jgi:murein DD-endopeptidase MepM/ murein hydrolase activator NlpD
MNHYRFPQFVATLALLLSGTPLFGQMSVAEYGALQTYFQTLHGSAQFPVAQKGFDDVESSFGPRFQTSTSKYDFHRGIDVDGVEGDDILAVTGGVFWEYREFQAGGHTVILRHDFDSTKTINGRSYDHYFTYYMHLFDDGIANNGIGTDDIVANWVSEKDNSGQGTQVSSGGHVGEMGSSGSSGGAAYADHLHMELRVGTTSSLIFQNDEPQTTQHGFDPHLHPMLLFQPYAFGGPDYTPTLQATSPYTANNDLRITYASNDEQPLLNRFEVRVVAVSDDSVVLEHTLDFNLRTGFDASEPETLDDQVTFLPYVDPTSFGDSSIVYSTELVIPESWVGVYDSSDYRIEVSAYDIWDNETAAAFMAIPEPRQLAFCIGILAACLATGRRVRR